MIGIKSANELMKRIDAFTIAALFLIAVAAFGVYTTAHFCSLYETAKSEIADLRAQIAEATEQKVLVVEPPKEMDAVNEAYTPAKPTTTVNGQQMERVTADELLGMTSLGTFTISHYDSGPCCCDPADGIGASGRAVIPYYSVAVDPSVIPLGSIIYLDYGDGVLHECRADDTGGAVVGRKLDLCVGDHATAVQYGVRTATVYVGGRGDG